MRRILKITAGLLLSILFLLLLVLSVIQSEAGQREIRNRLSNYISKELKTRVSFGYVGWDPIHGISVKDAFVEDYKQDTLFYVRDIKAHFKLYDENNRYIHFTKVSLDSVLVNFRQYHQSGALNFDYFLEAIDSGPSDSTRAPVIWTLLFEKIKLRNACFHLRFDDDTVSDRTFRENDMRFNQINADLTDFYVVDDSLNFTAKNLRLKEQNSFEIVNLDAHAIIYAQGMQFTQLDLQTPNSRLGDYFAMEYDHWRAFNNFYDDVVMKADLKKSEVSFKDLQYFSDNLLGWDELVFVEGEGAGPLRSMRARNMNLRFGQNSGLQGTIQMRGLPDIEQTYIDARIQTARTTREELAKLIPMDIWPDELERLGQVTYTGRFTGFIYDFVAYGNFQTALGNIRSDLNMKLNGIDEYSGELIAENFDIGNFFQLPGTGRISFNSKMDGKGFELSNMINRLEATVNHLEMNGYDYRNIQVKGLLKKQIYTGNVEIKDPNLEMVFAGKVGLSGEMPVFDCTSQFYKAEIAKLNWAPDFPAVLSGKLVADFSGTELDDFVGSLALRNIEIEKDKRVYPIDSLILLSDLSNGYRRMSVNGDILNAHLNGHFSPSLLDKSFNNFFAQLLPNSLKLERVEMPAQEFEFGLELKKAKEITELVQAGTWVNQGVVKGRFDSQKESLSLDVYVDEAHYSEFGFSQVTLSADSSVGDERFSLSLNCSEITRNDSQLVHGALVDLGVMRNNVDFHIAGYSAPYSTELNLVGKLHYNDTSMFTEFDPSYIRVDTLDWAIAGNSRLGLVSDSIFILDRFHIGTLNQSVTLNGSLMGNDQDRLDLSFERFRLEGLNVFLYPSGDESIQGEVNGDLSIKSFKGSIPLFTSDLSIDSLGMNGDYLGRFELSSRVPEGYEIITMSGLLKDGDFKRVSLSGFLKTSKEDNGYNLQLQMDTTPLHLFEPFFVDLASEFKGRGSGKIDIGGPLNKPTLNGKIYLDDAGIKVDYLNTYYTFNSVITVSSNRFELRRFKITDELGNTGFCSGYISHKNLSDFGLNIELNNLNNFLCLNTRLENNEYYYGTAFMTGSATFRGSFDDLRIDVKGKAEKNSAFFIPLENYVGSSELEFIRFVSMEDFGSSQPYQDLSGIQMNFDLELTPSTEIQLIFDSRLGDIIRSRGNAKLLMEINSNGDFKMYGDYVVDQGDYLFTAANLINKKFVIQRGGKIIWNGDPMKANMNLEATYTAKSSLESLVRGIVTSEQLSAYKQRTDVEAIMKLRGELTAPEIRFGLRIPNITSLSSSGINTSTVNTVLRKIEQDQEEMTRQVFSLLVANTFIPPAVNQQFVAADVQGGVLSSSVGDLLSNQVSNWLNQINSNWKLGVNYVMGNAQSNLLINASHKFMNDRLEIQGTFNTNTNNFYNNVSAMYRITPDGRLRVRAFNRTGTLQSSDPNSQSTSAINRNVNTQGIGLYYALEFDRLDKQRKELKRKLKEQTEPDQNP
ncbi:MAG: hypothetical protein GC180_02890 [Bacteroidetes bacterium]|nr:hypothetical protein [Bacteroidota bacterium]